MTDHSIRGKTVIIAGGAKNLGGLIARDFAKHGAKAIAVHYNSPATRAQAEETVQAVRSAGAEAAAFQGNLSTAAAVESLFKDAVGAFGRPDIAINTVGKCSRSRSSKRRNPNLMK
jgi:NAD(P)-dependent dehydrogenase (short-subunit alcohol dehydrogenase family)